MLLARGTRAVGQCSLVQERVSGSGLGGEDGARRRRTRRLLRCEQGKRELNRDGKEKGNNQSEAIDEDAIVHSASTAEDFEKLGVFYLGRPMISATKQSKPGWLLYDSKDLVTHAVCVGMTGSGKTGLCLALLEEAAIDGIPAIIIDPKGDLGNLMLTFPQLTRRGLRSHGSMRTMRARKACRRRIMRRQQAEMWKNGLADWQQDGARIQQLRDAADVAIYTPGSNAGIPVSILKSFAAPSPDVLDDTEMLRERISTTVTSLLGLARGRGRSDSKPRAHSVVDDSRPHMEAGGGSGSRRR